MRKWISAMLAFLIVFLSGCAKSSGVYYGDEVDKNTLVVCLDPGYDWDDYELEKILDELGGEIKSACGIERLAFEVLPKEGAEREMALQRLRTEIVAGEGPDVFIMQTVAVASVFGINKDALFNFPEKNMEAGLFLPLDEYMENSTQFTDWNAQTQVVLGAGRTDEGQVIIPMTYTFSVLVYPENEVAVPYTTELTMQDILSDPENAEIGALLYSNIYRRDEQEKITMNQSTRGLPYILGTLADYESEELLFTEDELYEALTVMLRLYEDASENQRKYIKNDASYMNLIYQIFNGYFDTDMALVPVYSLRGGVTASIRSYAAVNRNTRLPQDAFSVIDYLMREEAQRKSVLYSKFFVNGIPLQNDLGSEEKTLEAAYEPQRYLAQPYFEDLLQIKEQITEVNFQSNLDAVLEDLTVNAMNDESFSDEVVARAYVSEAYAKMKRMMGE